MLYRVTILFGLMTFCVGSLPLITRSQRSIEPSSQQGRRLTLTTKRVDHPDGRTVDSFTGRYQEGDKTVNLSAFTVKKGLKSRRSGQRSQNPTSNALFSKVSITNSPPTFLHQTDQNPEMAQDSYDPGYDYYYAYSEMTRSDGTVVAQAVYEYQTSANQNKLYLTVGGVTLTCDLVTEEMAPISDAEQEQLDAWGASADANIVRDVSRTIIEEGPQQSPSQLLLNYYAIALLVDDTTPTTASGPRQDSSQKNSLHHAVRKLRTPVESAAAPCEVKTTSFVTFRSSIDVATAPAIIAYLAPQCFGCCGPRCYCIRDRMGIAMYSQWCAEHDACVGQYGYASRQCSSRLIRAVLFVWWRS